MVSPSEAASASLALAPAVPAIPAPSLPGAATAPAAAPAPLALPKKKAYPSPGKYVGTPEAELINTVLDAMDRPPAGARIVDPASTLHVGECAVATWASMSTSEEVSIHPGYLLLATGLVYLAIVCLHRFGPKDEPQRPAQRQQAQEKAKEPDGLDFG